MSPVVCRCRNKNNNNSSAPINDPFDPPRGVLDSDDPEIAQNSSGHVLASAVTSVVAR